jgi:hypothetical protein
MRITPRLLQLASALAVLFVFGTVSGIAQNHHPWYLHALSDLRAARAHLERPNHGALQQQERDAIREIDAAIRDIKQASIDDGKDLNDHPPVDAKLDWPGRLHRALQLLDKAHSDISRDEDNKFAQGLQQKAFRHIDSAHHHVDEAIQVVASHA